MRARDSEYRIIDELTNAYFKAYMDGANNMTSCDSAAKKEKAAVYVNGLLQNGGPSTDIFVKEFGLEIPDSDAEKISTVGDVLNYIEAHK